MGDVAFLLTERAYDPNSRERLLQIAGDRRDPLAGDAIEVCGRDPEHQPADGENRQREECQQRHVGVEHEQDHDDSDQRQPGLEQRRHPVRDELVERLDVVRHPGDDHPGAVARVEADRQRLQVREQPHAQVL